MGCTNVMYSVRLCFRSDSLSPGWCSCQLTRSTGFPDPFAVATVGGEQTHTTSVIKKTLNPYWNEIFDLYDLPSSCKALLSRASANHRTLRITVVSMKTVFLPFKFSTKRNSKRRTRVFSVSSTCALEMSLILRWAVMVSFLPTYQTANSCSDVN